MQRTMSQSLKRILLKVRNLSLLMKSRSERLKKKRRLLISMSSGKQDRSKILGSERRKKKRVKQRRT